VRANIVRAIVEPVASVIKSYVGDEPEVLAIVPTGVPDPMPWLGVTIELRGNLVGPITCVVSDELARLVAQRMAATIEVDPALCAEAVAELANIITGNAAGRLLEEGYRVEITTPRPIAPGDEHLTHEAMVVRLGTKAGELKLLLGFHIHDEAVAEV
jgi:CheY-specific phosphatase CheX